MVKSILPNKTRTNKKASAFLASFLTAVVVGAGMGVSQFAVANIEGEGETPNPEISQAPVEAADSSLSVDAAVSPYYIPASLGGTTTLTITFSNPSTSAAIGVQSFDVQIPTGLSYQTNSSFINGTSPIADPTSIPPAEPGGFVTLSYDPAGVTPLLVVPQAPTVGNPGTATLQFDFSRAAGTSGTIQLGDMLGVDEGSELIGPTTTDFFATPAPTVLPVSEVTTRNAPLSNIPLNITAGTGATVDAPATCLVNPATTNCEKIVPVFQTSSPSTPAGTFTVDGSGVLSFNPTTDFIGSTQIIYRGFDSLGQSNENTVIVDVLQGPNVEALIGSAGAGVTVQLTPQGQAAQGTTLVPAATCVKENQSAGVCTNSLVLNQQGTLSFDPGTNLITFTPVSGYEGTVNAYYEMQDDLGGIGGNTIQITLSNTTSALPISATTGAGSVATLTPQGTPTPGETIVAVCVQPEFTSDPSECVASLTTSSGVWAYSASTGNITFTPDASFNGLTTAYYRVTDSNGGTAVASASVTVVAPPTVTAVTAETGTGGTATLTPNATAATGYTIDTSKTCLLTEITGTCGTSALVAGRGTFSFNASTNTVSFAAANSTATGEAVVFYRVTDSLGTNSTVTSTTTMTVTMVAAPVVPATAITATTTQGTAVELTPQATPQGNATINQSATCLKLTRTGTCTGTITIPGQGSYVYSATTGRVVFTPVSTYVSATNTPSVVFYQVTDSFGSTATGEFAVTVTAGSGGGGTGGTTSQGPAVTVTVTGSSPVTFPLCSGSVTANCIGNTTDTFDISTVEVYNASGQWATSAQSVNAANQATLGNWTATRTTTIALTFTPPIVSTPTTTTGTGTGTMQRNSTVPVQPEGLNATSSAMTLTPRATVPSGSVNTTSNTGTATASVRIKKQTSNEYIEQQVTVTGFAVSSATATGGTGTTGTTPGTGTTGTPGTGTTGTTGTIPGGTTGTTPGTGTTGITGIPGTGTGTGVVTPVVPTGVLPQTGGDIAVPAVLGFLLVVAGGMLLTVWGRQRKFGTA